MKVLAPEQRNALARRSVEQWIDTAKAARSDDATDFLEERRLLEKLIPINAAGFRGVVITAMIGKTIDANFDPTTDFYACNPRSIFEKGIYYALAENGIPCGKSDPLNVAKNVQVIDAAWAKGRRPEAAALAAVHYIKLLHDNWLNLAYRDVLIRLFFHRLWQFALFCQSKNRPLAAFEGIAPATLASRLAAFVARHPEGGATPQLVVGTLIRQLRLNDPDYASVEGVDESVFGTNTTSKKPADVWEVMADGSIGALYEITAKPIDVKRLDDCIGSLQRLGFEARIVTFICRIPEDIRPLRVEQGSLGHGGMAFQFLDMAAFIQTTFCLLKPAQQVTAITLIDEYVKETNRKNETKDGWFNLFGNLATMRPRIGSTLNP